MQADIRAEAKYAFGSFVVDTVNRRLLREGAPVAITARVFDILVVLVRYHGRPVEKDTLIEQVWGDQAVEEGNLTRNVSTLRKVLGEAPDDHRFIVTLPGRGYQFVAAVRLLDDVEPEPVGAPAAPDALPAVESGDVLPAAPVVDPPTLVNCAWTCARRCVLVAALVLVVVVTLAAAHALTRPGGGATANANEPNAAAMPWRSAAGAGRLSLVATHHRAFDPSLSPDGKMFVYATEDAEQRVDLFFGRTSGGEHVRLTNDSAYESAPRYSPDGERIAFTRRGSPDGTPEICTMPALGGQVACIIRPGAGATWSPDGSRLGFLRPAGAESPVELVMARTDGTDLRVLLRGDSQYPFPRQPAWSPDGTQLAVVRGTGGIAGELWLVPASGGAARKLSDEPAAVFSQAPVFTPDGRGLVYSSNRGGAINIWFRALDGSAPRQLTTGAGPDEWPSVARDGSVAFVNARWRNTLDIYGMSGGAPKILLHHSPYLWAPAFSPDGRDLAYTRGEVDGSWHIWTMPAGGGEARRLTSSATGEIYPRYTPDGQFVLYHTWGSPSRIWRVPAAGGTAQPVSSGTHSDGYADVSPDGRWIAFVRAEREGERVYVAPFDGGPERLLTASPGSVPRWSPDGRQIAFSRNRSFNDGIVLIDADGTHERRLTEKGGWPVWWPGGGRIAYLTLTADQRQEIHLVSTDGALPAPLAHVRFVHNNHPFDISRDGRWLATSNTQFVADEIWLLRPAAAQRAAR